MKMDFYQPIKIYPVEVQLQPLIGKGSMEEGKERKVRGQRKGGKGREYEGSTIRIRMTLKGWILIRQKINSDPKHCRPRLLLLPDPKPDPPTHTHPHPHRDPHPTHTPTSTHTHTHTPRPTPIPQPHPYTQTQTHTPRPPPHTHTYAHAHKHAHKHPTRNHVTVLKSHLLTCNFVSFVARSVPTSSFSG